MATGFTAISSAMTAGIFANFVTSSASSASATFLAVAAS